MTAGEVLTVTGGTTQVGATTEQLGTGGVDIVTGENTFVSRNDGVFGASGGCRSVS